MTDRAPPTAVQRLKGVARAELRHLITVQPSDRPWQLRWLRRSRSGPRCWWNRDRDRAALRVRHRAGHALALLPAEAATQGQAPVDALIRARFIDTVLGSAVGFAAAIFLHRPRGRRSMTAHAGAEHHPG